MDRFSETFPSYFTACYDRNEDGSPVSKEPELFECQSCGAKVESLSRAEWDSTLLVGACCEVAELDTEPEIPVSPEVYRRILHAATVEAVQEAFHNSRKKEVA